MNENHPYDFNFVPEDNPEEAQTPPVPRETPAAPQETPAAPQEIPTEQPPVYTARETQRFPVYEAPPSYTAPTPPPPKAAKEPKKKKNKGLGVAVIAIALCCGLLGSVFGGLIVGFSMRNSPETPNSAEAGMPVPESTEGQSNTLESTENDHGSTQVLTSSGKTPAQVYADNVAAVVGISNESTTYNIFGQVSETASSGSGFIISPDGEILTNYHVVQGAQTLTVTLHDGREYAARVLGYEAASDVALIKIDGENLPTVTLGSSSELFVGAEVAAIGNPLGELTYSLNVGYVSAMDRAVNTDGTPINMMQIDVSINSGNSGGPLFDLNGEVVGIITAKYSGTTGGGTTIEGIGFAIPIDDISSILSDLRENGAVLDRAYIGIGASSITEAESQRYSLPLGAYVESVEKTACGFRAGLQVGDIITALDDTVIKSYEDLSGALRKYRAGDQAVITVYRGGQTLKLDITFDAKPLTSTTEVPPTEESTVFNPWEYFFP